MQIDLKIIDQRLGRDFPLPRYESAAAAGMDLRAMLTEDTVIKAGQSMLIPTGFAMHIKDPAVCAVVLPRSGLGFKHGIVLGNLTGLIDADYQGQLFVPLWNRSSEDFVLHPGERMAQLVFLPIVRADFKVEEDFEESERAQGGFGSTGIS
ncbi:MAG: dUTP diphosphatase [Proteobacteria bacterium]|uniref:Deoxyuridine 5'-triphosphate nucleotidohydrolase n=1 Tax=Candidatus Avisuccinivibrio stercorigallinarum TaxID=2840704 RepID=A0A9D9GU82_9GAMM|nr:dUTP diphosphatase [Candidatus Avisuccinivibrio stercorigallinarum]